MFKLITKDKKYSQFTVKMAEEDVEELRKIAKIRAMNFHRFIKSILLGYIYYTQTEVE